MIKEELMIGDWVSHSSEKWQWKPTDYQISEDTMYEIGPIPITEDILKLNGWQSVGRYDHYTMCIGPEIDSDGNYKWLPITKDLSHNDFYCKNHDIHIKYVHELQHLLRLCKMNNMANNFKIE